MEAIKVRYFINVLYIESNTCYSIFKRINELDLKQYSKKYIQQI